MPYLGHLTPDEAAARYSTHPFYRRYTRDELVSDWQNMVLGGEHGRHQPDDDEDDDCSSCRGLNVPHLLMITW